MNVSNDIPTIGIRYSIYDVESRVNLKDHTFQVKATPSKHKFQIKINNDYEELCSDLLGIEGRIKNSYNGHPLKNYNTIKIEVDTCHLFISRN